MRFKTSILYAIAAFVSFGNFLSSQSFPLSENDWSNPEFVDRFLGTYAVRSETEPKISTKENELFNEIAGMLNNDQTGEAITRLQEYMTENAQSDPPPSPALDYTLGNLHLQEGNTSEALESYQTAIKRFPDFLRAYKNLGLAQIQRGNYEKALPHLVKAVELGDRNGDTFGLLGYCYLNTGNDTAALEGYRQATLLNPGNREWMVGKAEALMRTENYNEAIAVFKSLIKKDPAQKSYYTSLANAYLSKGEESKAANYLEVVRRMGQGSASTLTLLGDIYLNDDLPGLALSVYLDAFETDSGEITMDRAIRVAQVFLQRAHLDQAEKFISMAEDTFAEDMGEDEELEILNLKAQLALAKGDSDKAAEVLEKVIRQDPMNGNALLLLASYNERQGDVEEAEYYYERAQKVDDVARDAYVDHAQLKVQQKEYREAVRLLQSAQKLEFSQNVQNYLDAVKTVADR